MQLFVGFACGLLCLVTFFVGGALGMGWGQQSVVDQTLRQGFFEAYGKRYRAVEIADDNAQGAR